MVQDFNVRGHNVVELGLCIIHTFLVADDWYLYCVPLNMFDIVYYEIQ